MNLLALALIVAARQEVSPMIGEAPPPLKVTNWINGPAVRKFEKGKTYLIDIWASWCGPCKGGMPHLSDLQDKYRADGLVVIGLSSPDTYGNSLDSTRKVLLEHKDEVRYRFAWDKEGESYKAWMKIDQDKGWPWAFIVDKKGRLAYIGHPERMDEALDQIIKGTYDLAAAKAAYLKRIGGHR